MIRVRGLSKKFDGSKALSGLDMNIPTGAVYGLVGANGAGKTTIIKHLAGVIRQNSGTIEFDGAPVYENEGLKERIGVIPDELYFPQSYSLKNMRSLYSGMYANWNDDRFHEMTELFKLNENEKIKSFSKGMKKQAMFCLVVSTMPSYLLLDEPIDGLDPIAKKLVWNFITRDVEERRMTVLVSSHNLKELQDICDYIGIISEGKMLLEKKLGSLKTNLHKVQVSFGNVEAIGTSIKEAPSGRPFASDTNVYEGSNIKEEVKFDPYKGLNIIHKESRGTVDLLILDDDLEVVRKTLLASEPVIMDILPLTLEELFIYELGGENDDIRKLIS